MKQTVLSMEKSIAVKHQCRPDIPALSRHTRKVLEICICSRTEIKMTRSFVPFVLQLSHQKGEVILEESNASFPTVKGKFKAIVLRAMVGQ